MLRIAVCDDSSFIRGITKKSLVKYSFQNNIDVEIDEYETGELLLQAEKSGEKQHQLIFIDYEFEEGMTWGEWLTSPYNTNGFKLSYRPSYHRDDMVLGSDECYIYYSASNNAILYSNDVIVENEYYWSIED